MERSSAYHNRSCSPKWRGASSTAFDTWRKFAKRDSLNLDHKSKLRRIKYNTKKYTSILLSINHQLLSFITRYYKGHSIIPSFPFLRNFEQYIKFCLIDLCSNATLCFSKFLQYKIKQQIHVSNDLVQKNDQAIWWFMNGSVWSKIHIRRKQWGKDFLRFEKDTKFHLEHIRNRILPVYRRFER